MFRWYSEAKICFAYLSDIQSDDDMTKSAWFSRGWTLQELIAPREMKFYDRQWRLIGSRIELWREINLRTMIDDEVLKHNPLTQQSIQSLLASIPVGRRLSWAAGRKAKRVEDRAYSLLGILASVCLFSMGKVTELSFDYKRRSSPRLTTCRSLPGRILASLRLTARPDSVASSPTILIISALVGI